MSAAQSSRNQFLSGLTLEDFSLLRSHLVLKDLSAGDVLQRSGEKINEVVFPHAGVAVMRSSLHDGAGPGIALIGPDEYAGGFAATASAPATCDYQVLIGGKASHIAATAFRHALDRSATLRHRASQFDNALLAQVQQTAVCNAAHSVEARMCRWLLEVQERSESERIPLTQGTFAELLGVRRTTVTLVAGQLEAAGAIDCRRGYMRVIDRSALEHCCCECYTHPKRNPVRLAPLPDEAVIAGTARALTSGR